MKLQHVFESRRTNQNGQPEQQTLILSAEANSRREAEELNYEDFKLELFVNGKFIADISAVLAQTGVYNDLIDRQKWEEKFSNKMRIVVHEEIEMP